MATGVSKTKWNNNHSNSIQADDLPEQSFDVSLSYEGKRTEAEILATNPAAMKILRQSDEAENYLYYGDNLPILASFLHDDSIRDKVRLVYIDPPFATKSVFQSRSQSDAYSDLLAGAHYIEFIRQRLIILKELLAPDGSIYVHLDENIKITGYPTEKNSELLARIIEASSNPGDLVLDCFAGSGTTLDVAARLGRKWIGIDNSPEAIKTTLRRFARGLERMGDFVTQRPSTPVQPMLPNLDLPASTILNDFSLFTTLPYSGDLDEALK